MDRSLDEIISARPQKQSRRGRGSRNTTSNAPPRDGVKKSYRDRVDLDRDWVHDRFDDNNNGDSRSHRRDNRSRRDWASPDIEQPARLRIDNLHYDLTEEDLEGLFGQIGPVSRVRIDYDRAGRSEGIAIVTYEYLEDARKAIREYDGANAKGQPIRLTLLPPGGGGGGRGAAKAEKSRSLFDRIERPHDRDERSLSPDDEGNGNNAGGGGGGRRRRGGRGRGGTGRRSDVSKPAPEHIDRYVPGQEPPSSNRRNTGRRPGERREEKRKDGRQNGVRPRKTQEELDQEMDDYWGTTTTTTTTAGAGAGTEAEAGAETAATTAPAAAADDDIDMIE